MFHQFKKISFNVTNDYKYVDYKSSCNILRILRYVLFMAFRTPNDYFNYNTLCSNSYYVYNFEFLY